MADSGRLVMVPSLSSESGQRKQVYSSHCRLLAIYDRATDPSIRTRSLTRSPNAPPSPNTT